MRGFRYERILVCAILLPVVGEDSFCSSRQEAPYSKTVTSFVAPAVEERAAGGAPAQAQNDALATEEKGTGIEGEEKGARGEKWAPEAKGKARAPASEGTLIIAAAGDVMMHGRVKSAAHHQASSPSEEGDSKHGGWWRIFKRLQPVLEGCDIAVANLETPVATERVKTSGKPPVLNGPPEALDAMKEAGFSVLSFANNHAFDQLRQGVAETVAAIKRAGLEVVGAGNNREEAESPLLLERRGVKVALFAWTLILNRNYNEVKTDHKPWVAVYTDDLARKSIQAVRGGVDLVIVIIHWGGEFEMKAGRKQKELAAKICSAGADIILGSHPHILHKVEFLEVKKGGAQKTGREGTREEGEESTEGRKCLVAYSLGNLISNQGFKYCYGWKPPNLVEAKNIPYTRDGIILRVRVSKGAGGGISFDAVEAVPIWTENNWVEKLSKGAALPDDLYIIPIIPALKLLPGNDRRRLLLEERLAAIKEMVGSTVTYVEE